MFFDTNTRAIRNRPVFVGVFIVPPSYKLFYYNKKRLTLRKAIDKVIARKKGWAIRMSSKDQEHKLGKARIHRKNINTVSFFAPLSSLYPYITVGCRFSGCYGGKAHY